MEKINKKTLVCIVEGINEQTKEQYTLRQSNGSYSLLVSLESGGLSTSHFGTDLCLSAREMYYYLRGLQRAISALRWSGT